MNIQLVLICSALLAAATSASAVEPMRDSPRERALMLYFSKSFGSTQRQNRAPLAFGLRLQQSAPIEGLRPLALLDARLSLGGRKQFLLGGLNAFDSSGDSSDESGTSSETMSQQHPGWTAAMVVLAVIGILCATETGICKGGGHGSDYTPPAPTGPG